MTNEEITAIIEKEFHNYEIISKKSDFSYKFNLKLKGYTKPEINITYHEYSSLIGYSEDFNHISIYINSTEIMKIFEYQMVEHIRLYKSEIDKYVLKQAESYKILENIKDIELNSKALIKKMIRDDKINSILC